MSRFSSEKDMTTSQLDEEVIENVVADAAPNDLPLKFEEEPDEEYKLGWRSLAAIVALALANCCAVITNTTNTTIRYQIASVGGANLASWVANGNFLLTLCFGPIFGSLGDRLGKKWFIIAGCLIGIVGSCISGSSPSVERIIGGNALTGIANAGCIVSIAANQEVTKNKHRPLAMGINQTIGSCTAILGVFLAAGFVKHDAGGNGGWRWAYYFNAIVYAIAGLAVFLAYHPPPPLLRRQNTLYDLFRRIDFGGILLLTGSLASLLLALTWGGSTYAWNSKTIIATLVCGCVGLVIFGLYEWLVVSDGLFDHRLMKNRNFPILLFVCLIDGMLLLGINVLYAQQIAQLFTHDAVKIAAIISPFLIASTFGCLPFGWVMARTRSYRVMLVSALFWCSLFTGLMALVTPNRLAMALVFEVLFGIGTAITTVIPITALALSIPSFLLGTAGTISISCRALGGIVGVTLFTAIFDNKLGAALPAGVSKVVFGQGYNSTDFAEIMTALSSENPAALFMLPFPPQLLGAVEGAVVAAQTYSWKYVWIAIACVVAGGGLACCALNSVKQHMNEHIESALERSETRNTQMSVKV